MDAASGMSAFGENDVPLILGRLPEAVVKTHDHADEVHIAALLEPLRKEARFSPELVAATIWALLLTLPVGNWPDVSTGFGNHGSRGGHRAGSIRVKNAGSFLIYGSFYLTRVGSF